MKELSLKCEVGQGCKATRWQTTVLCSIFKIHSRYVDRFSCSSGASLDMWLLNTRTRRLLFFVSERQVPGGYAILSHTWEMGEVTFDEVHKNNARKKLGYRKIDFTCQQALRDGFNYAWVDTCE